MMDQIHCHVVRNLHGLGCKEVYMVFTLLRTTTIDVRQSQVPLKLHAA